MELFDSVHFSALRPKLPNFLHLIFVAHGSTTHADVSTHGSATSKRESNTNHIVLTTCFAKPVRSNLYSSSFAGPTAAAHNRKKITSRFGVTLRLAHVTVAAVAGTYQAAPTLSLSATSLN